MRSDMQAEYERCVFSAAFSDPSVIDAEKIPESIFTDARHRRVWHVMTSLRGAGNPVNLLTVKDSMNGDGEDISPAYLASLSTPGAADVSFYVDKLLESARERDLSLLLKEKEIALGQGQDAGEVIADIEAGLSTIRSRGNATATVRPADALREILSTAEARVKSGASGPTGIPSGFSQLDSYTGGFQDGDLILVAARTSVGKSALALSWIERQIEAGHKPALASLEMSAIQVWQRLIAMRSLVSTGKIRFGKLDGDDFRAMVNARIDLERSGFDIIDRPNITTGVLRSWASQMVAEGHGILYVDYVGLMRGSNPLSPRWEQMLQISAELKSIARELRIPVVALVQLNREAAEVREPGLHNIRDSGALEQDADVCMILTRWEKESIDDSVPAKLYLKKQRSGPTGMIELVFRKSLTQFREATV